MNWLQALIGAAIGGAITAFVIGKIDEVKSEREGIEETENEMLFI